MNGHQGHGHQVNRHHVHQQQVQGQQTNGQQANGQQNHGDGQDYQSPPAGAEPPTVASLGYEYRERGREWDSDEAGRVQIQYTVTQPGNAGRIMTIGYNVNNGRGDPNDPESDLDDFTLFVEWIAMEYDNRPQSERPKARDLLAAMWVHVFRRPLMLLRRIYFEAVIEPSTRNVIRDTVCPLMGIGWDEALHSPTEQFILFQPGRLDNARQGNDEAYEAVRHHTRLVKIVASITKRYPQMKQPGCPLTVAEIKIIPSYGRMGEQGAFDMEVVLEDGDSSDTA